MKFWLWLCLGLKSSQVMERMGGGGHSSLTSYSTVHAVKVSPFAM